MNIRYILIAIVALAVLGVSAYSYMNTNKAADDKRAVNDIITTPVSTSTPGEKLKADVFSGKLEEVNTGCFADGECYIVVGGKHVTVLMGWSQEIVGSIVGADSIGDLESHIGKDMEVYAQDKSDGTYTLYGSSGFYAKLK